VVPDRRCTSSSTISGSKIFVFTVRGAGTRRCYQVRQKGQDRDHNF
jgi:hypothetical protein